MTWDEFVAAFIAEFGRHPLADVQCPTCHVWGTTWEAMATHFDRCAAREAERALLAVEGAA